MNGIGCAVRLFAFRISIGSASKKKKKNKLYVWQKVIWILKILILLYVAVSILVRRFLRLCPPLFVSLYISFLSVSISRFRSPSHSSLSQSLVLSNSLSISVSLFLSSLCLSLVSWSSCLFMFAWCIRVCFASSIHLLHTSKHTKNYEKNLKSKTNKSTRCILFQFNGYIHVRITLIRFTSIAYNSVHTLKSGLLLYAIELNVYIYKYTHMEGLFYVYVKKLCDHNLFVCALCVLQILKNI